MKTTMSEQIKAAEEIKAQLLSEIANLYSILAEFSESAYDRAADSAAAIAAMDYILARRIGVGFDVLDERICRMARLAAQNTHKLEQEFGDMSALYKYIEGRR